MSTRHEELRAARAALQHGSPKCEMSSQREFEQFVLGFDRAIEVLGALIENLPGTDARGFDAVFADAGYREAQLHAELALEALRP